MTPQLSIVVTGRNDGYGGDFLGRMTAFVRSLLWQLDRFDASAELVVVEWNPPAGRPGLRDAIPWPRHLEPGRVRVIEVPAHVHARLEGSDRIGLFEYFAKNVGLRRAHGRFVLATNPDVIFSRELAAFLARGRFREDAFYRIDRHDFHPVSLDRVAPKSIPRAVARRAFRVLVREGELPVVWRDRLRARWTRSWPGTYRELGGTPLESDASMPLEDGVGALEGLHTHASGDFLLASAECWRAIRGFAEFADMCTHWDSYACQQLKALGLQQRLLVPPCVLFHADHDRKEQASRPRYSKERCREDLRKIREGAWGPALSGPGWGFADIVFPETTIV